MADDADALLLTPWEDLGDSDVCIRQWTQYKELLWERDIDIEMCMARMAAFGGPIALARNPKKLVQYTTSMERIRIYSASGRRLARFKPLPSQLVEMGWTADEHLVCVYSDGHVMQFTMHGETLEQSFELGLDDPSEKVAMCSLCSTGMAALTRNEANEYNVYLVQDFHRPAPLLVRTTGLSLRAKPSCVMCREKHYSLADRMEVFIGTSDSSVIVLTDADDAEDQLLNEALGSTPVFMDGSPDGELYAFFGEDGYLTIMTSDFEAVKRHVNTEAEGFPSQMLWLESAAVACVWDTEVKLYGVTDATLCFDYIVPFHVSQEFDSLRIITSDSMEMLEVLQRATFRTRDLRSTADATNLLFITNKHFESQDAEEILQDMKAAETLKDAVEDCLSAAAAEFHEAQQQALLKAASYGKRFLDGYDSTRFVHVCRMLRVLNSLRRPAVGMPLTFRQLERLTLDVAIDRLTFRRCHQLALQLCEFLKLRKDKVLVHWACEQVRTGHSHSDDRLRDMVTSRLGRTNGVSFSDVAAAANRAGRHKLAAMLLEYEPRTADQVPLLLQMRAGEKALEKALDSGDTELVYLCLLTLRREMATDGGANHTNFLKLLLRYPKATSLFIKYCRANDRVMLKVLYLSFGRCAEAARLEVLEAFRASAAEGRQAMLRAAGDVLKKGVPKDKRLGFYASAVDDETALLGKQVQLNKVTESYAFLGGSVSETLYQLVLRRRDKEADTLISQFKIPPSRAWHVKVQALAELRDWRALRKLADKKKSPIGYKHFADACFKAKERTEAMYYVAKIKEPDERCDMYMKLGHWMEATDAAIKSRDVYRLNEIGTRCSAPEVRERVMAALKSLT